MGLTPAAFKDGDSEKDWHVVTATGQIGIKSEDGERIQEQRGIKMSF
jgi:hypothetical protein